MNHKTLVRFAESAYIRAIPDLLHGELRPGRLSNLYGKLVKAVDADLVRLPVIGDSDVLVIRDIIVEFGKRTGWTGKKRHVGTLLSFAIAIIESSEHKHNPKILETLNLIVEYYERKQNFKIICCHAGAIAAEKWQMVCNDFLPKNGG